MIATNGEQALRAAVKLANIWSMDDYLRVDELAGGRGYADVAFVPKPGSALPPMVVSSVITPAERDVIRVLDQWVSSSRRLPLVMCGARQVDKTYTLKDLGRLLFSSCAYVNFMARAPKLYWRVATMQSEPPKVTISPSRPVLRARGLPRTPIAAPTQHDRPHHL